MPDIITISETDSDKGPSHTLDDAIRTITSRLSTLSKTDPELAEACGILGHWLVDLSVIPEAEEDPQAASRSEPAPPRVDRVLSIGGMAVPVSVEAGGTPIHPPPDHEPVSKHGISTPALEQEEVSLATISERARLKAECCRWAITRRKRMKDGVEFEQHIKPSDERLVARAKALPNCYAWPLDPFAFIPEDRLLDDSAGCYETLADAVELGERISRDEKLFDRYGTRVYELIVECCSALRIILIDCDIKNDADQMDAFNWIKYRAYREQIYISRYMRLNDPADPTSWPTRRDEIVQVVESIEADNTQNREVKNLLGRIDYTAKRWGDYGSDERIRQTNKLEDAIGRLADLGLRTSDPRIRDPLLSIADELPDEVVPEGAFAEALRYADEYAARREVESGADATVPAEPTPEVMASRKLLEGKVVVLIGGLCRPHSRDRLQHDLGLTELRWISTRPHESVDGLAAEVRRNDVDLVMLAIRWSRHSYDEVKHVCELAGKPYVRLPRGYGVNQVAREIVAQVSDELSKI